MSIQFKTFQAVCLLFLRVSLSTRSIYFLKNICLYLSNGIKLAKVSGCAPAVESCYTLEEVTADPLIMAMKQTAETAIPMPNIPEMDVMWTVAGDLLTNVNMSGQDIESAAAAAQKKALELIEAMK